MKHSFTRLLGKFYILSIVSFCGSSVVRRFLGLCLLPLLLAITTGLNAQAPVTFNTSGTWTCPPGVTKVFVECWGAGGGGGSRTTNGQSGGGGGGAYACSTLTVIPGNTYNIVVGNGGSANSDGDNTSFHTNMVMAEGGKGCAQNSTAGGAGGLGTNSIGSFFFNGGNGANGGSNGGGGGGGAGSLQKGSNASSQNGGAGGSVNGGAGGNGATGNANGSNGNNYGGGGGGAKRTSGTKTGGTGANGLLVISPIVWKNEISGTNPNTANPFMNGSIVENHVSVSGISRGSGITGVNANNRYNANGWPTSGSLNSNDYFEFTVMPEAGYAMNLYAFEYSGTLSNNTSKHSFRSSLNSFGSNIGSPITSGARILLTAPQYQDLTSAITFRFYAYELKNSSTEYSIDDFVFYGNVYPVPVINSFTPGSACAGSGATITINGDNFSDASAVRFNGVNAASFNVVSNSQITAIIPGGASSGPITVVTPNATATSGSNLTVNPQPSFPAPFSVSSPSVCKGQQNVSYTVPLNAGVSYNWSYSGTGATFSSNTNTVSVDFAANATSGTLSVTASNACGNSSARTIAITVNDIPNVTISPDYCSGTGFVKLTASSGSSYLWSTGQTNQIINVDQAGNYQVTVTNAAGCSASESIDVAQELVVNGNFEAGNTGFTTAYTYNAAANGLYPEGNYAVNNNANFNHNLFYGKDHTNGSGKFMIINGSPLTGTTIWSQNNISVQPNTTYYFSAWGLSLVNSNNAILQFSINGFQVGTIAYLPNGYSSPSGPFNWVRFYGSWNSGPSTTADLSIVNLNTVLGGNDFGLDDISFGTLSPVPLAASPNANSGGAICVGEPLYLSANAIGGASPFSFAWTGPGGFTSNSRNPTVSNSASTAHNGTYSLTVTDGFGCSVSSSISVTVNSLPANPTATVTNATVCSGTGTTVQISSSENGVYYQLRNNADLENIGTPVSGNGGTISLPSGNLSASITFNILAVSANTGCGRILSSKPSVAVTTTPVLSITNQAACTGTIDLTQPDVTAGSTGGGTLTYWTNAAATIAMGTPTIAANGTYYIKSEVSGCYDIKPVIVRISNAPVTTFSYTGSPFCTSGINPLPTFSGGGVAGIFSATPAGLVFESSSTGEINLSASSGGTYIIKNTITPAGACGSFSSTKSITITKAPVASFQYTSNNLCQSANAADPAPVFINGGIAGTFSSSFGLNINATTGLVDISECLPGNYAVVNTIAAASGCPSVSDTVFIDVNPYTFDGSVSTSVSKDIICTGETVQLLSTGTSYLSSLLSENFNGGINNWTTTNSSTGGTPSKAAWTLRPDKYNSDATFRSNDNSQFYLSHSRDQNGTVTNTILRSPQLSTLGYTTLSLNFWHYFNYDSKTGESAKVEVSTNGLTWTSVATYTSDQGSASSFVNPTINLDVYVGYPVFYVRFNYYAGGRARYWAIDNVTIAGVSTNYSYDWSSSPSGFTSNDQNPYVSPTTNTFYVLNATNTYGCSTPVSPVPVTVKQLPVLSSSLTPPAICSGNSFNYTPSSSSIGATFNWTRAAVAGISNAAVLSPQNTNPSEVLHNTTGTAIDVNYQFEITAEGCSNNQVVKLSVNPKPQVTTSGNIVVCNGSSASLTAMVNNAQLPITYLWSPASPLNDPTLVNPVATLSTASESFSLTVTDGNGCEGQSAPLNMTNYGFGGTPGLWTGSVDSDWNNCRNWSDGKVPVSTTNVLINQTSGVDCQITGTAVCNSLQISSNGNNAPDLTITSTGSLAVTNDITIQKTAGSGYCKLIMMGAAQMSCKNLFLTGINPGDGNAVFLNEDYSSKATIHGELRLNHGGNIILTDGNNLTPDATLFIRGNFTNNAESGDFIGDLATLVFEGNKAQHITCPEGQKISHLIVNNSNNPAIVLNSNLQIEDSLKFINGKIDLNGNNLILGSTTQNIKLLGQDDDSYVIVWKGMDNGRLIHHINNTGHAYLFPIGDMNDYTPFSVNMNSGSMNNAQISAALKAIPHPQKGNSTTFLNRFWNIEPDGISNPQYDVEYYFAATDVSGDPGSLFPAKFSNGSWQSCQESNANAQMGNGSVDAPAKKLSWSGLNSFSDFTAFGDGSPLPVELLIFYAEAKEDQVLVNWATATEINNDYFMVQRSTDAVNFNDFEKVNGAGNSNSIRKYLTYDKHPLEGISYYRLKQVDFNGTVSYSEVVPVKFSKEDVLKIEDLIPNSEQQQVVFRLTNPDDNRATIQIYDAAGKNIYQASPGRAEKNWQGTLNLGTIPKGVYFITFRIKGQNLTRKFVY